MNINDFESIATPEKPLHFIFAEQRKLMEKYHEIEKANGLLITEDIPVNIHDAKGQQRLKDFAWRFMEEIGEALESLFLQNEEAHTKEELADALHFFVEMCILSGITADDLEEIFNSGGESFPRLDIYSIYLSTTLVVMWMGCACNTLKNKPWKQTQMLTDVNRYRKCMKTAFSSFLSLCWACQIKGTDELFDLYFRKSQVNHFRQGSNY